MTEKRREGPDCHRAKIGHDTRAFGRCVPIAGGALAMTLGHIVIGRSEHAMELTRAHERVHVRQSERWGPFFIPAYFLAGLIAILRGGNGYRDNHFESEARVATRALRR